jgi:TPR repeat protein
VGYFHALSPSVIHRDLKPSNILVERDRKHPDHWRLRIADFGIGNFAVKTALDRERMITSLSLAAQVQRAHTPLYASPQQRLWKEPDPRDDIYSLGMIWYQLLCDDLYAPVPFGNWFSPFLDRGSKREYLELIGSCLANDADKRPANGNQLLERLGKIESFKTTVSSEPTALQPSSPDNVSISDSSLKSDYFAISSPSDPNDFELSLTDFPTDTRNQTKDNLGEYDPQWKDIFQDVGEYEEAKLTSNEAVNTFLRAKVSARLTRWKEAGKVNLAEALHLIAECYDRGIGFTQNKEKATTIFRAAKEKGYVPPPSLGDEWDDEIPDGINPTLQSDFENAKKGDRIAQFNVGWAYMEGEGIEQNDEKAIEWYRRSADQGYMLAEYNMGWMYDRGRGVPKDEKIAVEWYIKAANQGYTDAAYNLGIIYANGRGVPKDEKKAVEWYIKAAEKGHESAQFNLGIHYSNGRGVPQDDAKAIEWYEKAAFQGAADAQYNLALLYANSKGSLRDDKKAVEWYTRAAIQGYMAAQHNLALMYEDGQGVTRDPEKALEWYEKAAFQGYARSQYNLGLMYANGAGITKDDKQAVVWYRRAAEQGFASAQHNLGLMYEDGRGIEKDPSTAVLWYRKAAEQGFVNAQYALGLMYEDGRGVMKDDKKAVEWYRKSAEQGYSPAECGLGVMFEYGRGVMKDEKQAVEWYRKSALKGLAEALYNLGRMYDYGKGVPQDDNQALEWYQKAVERGYSNALKNIATIRKRAKK